MPCTFFLVPTVSRMYVFNGGVAISGTISAPHGTDLVLGLSMTDLNGVDVVGVAPAESATNVGEVGPVTTTDATGASYATFHVPATTGNTTITLTSGSVSWTGTLKST